MSEIPVKYRPIVGSAAKAAGAVGIPGAFSAGLDVAAMSGVWLGMTMAIAHESDHEVDAKFAAKLMTSVATGVAAYVAGSKLLTTALHFAFPGAGTLAVIGINSFLNFWFTYRVGRAVASLFDRPDFTALDVGELAQIVIPMVTPIPGPREVADAIDLAVNTPLVPPDTFKIFEQYKKR